MFNNPSSGVFSFNYNHGYFVSGRYSWLNGFIITQHRSIICNGANNVFRLPLSGVVFKLVYLRDKSLLKMMYMYIVNEFIFDRRFIYSILSIRGNRSRSRRTKRLIKQHFYGFFYGIAAPQYMEDFHITAQASTIYLLTVAEYFNTIWFLFWYDDWLSATEKRFKVPGRGKKGVQKWYFNLRYISKKKPITYIPKKLKKNKKNLLSLKTTLMLVLITGI